MTAPDFLELSDDSFRIRTKAPGPLGSLQVDEKMLAHSPSGDVFGLTQNAGMGWVNSPIGGDVLILSTMGGLRNEDGTPTALGLHTGHWELGLLVREAALELRRQKRTPFAVYCSDPCDGRTQGTAGMMDSLAYRNSACEVLGRLVRSLPTRKAIVGIATCDKGLPAMMMAMAEAREFPGVLIPGGVTLPPIDGEDAGAVQSIGVRFAHGELTLKEAADLGCRACASSGGGCQFLGTAATSQVIGEALGLSLPHSALMPSGEPAWLELARMSARAAVHLQQRGIMLADILTDGAIQNAMAVHAAFGGSTNLLLHLPAIAFCAGLRRPTVEDWIGINRKVSRIVDVLPNGPRFFKTVQVFLAGGVPEVMLHLRNLGVLNLDCMTVTGETVGTNLARWETSQRRRRFREILSREDGVDANDVIFSPAEARSRGMGTTLIFPAGNLAPQGSVVKSTAIEARLWDGDVYERACRARVFVREEDAIAAVKSTDANRITPGDVIVLLCRGPLGAGMPETAQITIALKYTKALHDIALMTDGRFSGLSSGPCIGHVGPEALADGPIGKLRDGDWIRVRLDRSNLTGTVDLVGDADTAPLDRSVNAGDKLLSQRTARADLAADPRLPAATRLWAALQNISGGTWGGCVYDTDRIVGALERCL